MTALPGAKNASTKRQQRGAGDSGFYEEFGFISVQLRRWEFLQAPANLRVRVNGLLSLHRMLFYRANGRSSEGLIDAPSWTCYLSWACGGACVW